MDDLNIENMQLYPEEIRKKVSRVSFFCLLNLVGSRRTSLFIFSYAI